MKKEYDLSNMEKRKNPFAQHLHQQVTFQIGVDILEYFTNMADETGIPCQNLINLYLRDCVKTQKQLFPPGFRASS